MVAVAKDHVLKMQPTFLKTAIRALGAKETPSSLILPRPCDWIDPARFRFSEADADFRIDEVQSFLESDNLGPFDVGLTAAAL